MRFVIKNGVFDMGNFQFNIVFGEIEMEFIDKGMGVDDVQKTLRYMSNGQKGEFQLRHSIATAKRGVTPHSSKSNMQDKLNAKPRMPI